MSLNIEDSKNQEKRSVRRYEEYNSEMSRSRSGSRRIVSSKARNKSKLCSIICNNRDAVVTINSYNSNGDNYKDSCGFLIKDYNIICPADIIMNNTDIMDNIIVTIPNISKKGKSYIYKCKLVGLDGAGNIAILNFENFEDKKNLENPYLIFGQSRELSPGEKVIILGNKTMDCDDPSNKIDYGAHVAIIGDNRYMANNGKIKGELLLLSGLNGKCKSGMPVITKSGYVVGMTINLSNEIPVALSQCFMKRPINKIISVLLGKKDDNGQLNLISSNNKEFLSYRKAWVGIKGKLCTPYDIISVTDKYDGIKNEVLNPLKELVGIVVSSTENLEPNLPFGVGDVITHINTCPLGFRKYQISPSLIMWRVNPGDQVTLKYYKKSEFFQKEHQISVFTQDYPENFDHPNSEQYPSDYFF